jgi:hypothetical protein
MSQIEKKLMMYRMLLLQILSFTCSITVKSLLMLNELILIHTQ